MPSFFNQIDGSSLQNSASNNNGSTNGVINFNEPWKGRPRNKRVRNTKRGPGKYSH